MLVVLLIIGTILSAPNVRSAAYRAFPELVEYGFRAKLRYFVQNRLFESANGILLSQINFVEWFSSQRNVLLPGLVANAEFVVERIRNEQDYIKISSFLNRFVSSNPKLLPAHLWVARAHILEKPHLTFKHLNIAKKLAPAEGQIYRIALETALLHNLPKQKREWCQSYYQARQFGGPHPYEYEPMFRGVGERKIAVDTFTKDGRYQLIENFGLQLDKETVYSFNLNPGDMRRLRVHLAIGAGYQVEFGDFDIYRGGAKRTVPSNKLILSSWSSFTPKKGLIYTTSADGATITIHTPPEVFGEVDRLDIRMRVRRLPPVSPDVCAVG